MKYVVRETGLAMHRQLIRSYTITGRGIGEWQYIAESLPLEVRQILQESFKPERAEEGHNYILMKVHGYYWAYTYAKGYLTIIITPAPPDHPDGSAYLHEIEALLHKAPLSKLLVIRH